MKALKTVERLAEELRFSDRHHLWPDKSLGNVAVTNRMQNPQGYIDWLRRWWGRVSEWPGAGVASSHSAGISEKASSPERNTSDPFGEIV